MVGMTDHRAPEDHMTDTPTSQDAHAAWRELTRSLAPDTRDRVVHFVVGYLLGVDPAESLRAIEAARETFLNTHDCANEVVEEGTTPAPNGSFTVTERCGVCKRVVGTHVDSVL